MKHSEMLDRMEKDIGLVSNYEDVAIRLTKIVYTWIAISRRRLVALEADAARDGEA